MQGNYHASVTLIIDILSWLATGLLTFNFVLPLLYTGC